MCGIIYVITNTVNGKQYVGQTTLTLTDRWGLHLKSALDCFSMGVLHCAIRKYGVEAFAVEQIDAAESQDELNGKEIYHVARLGTYGGGYNLTPGGRQTKFSEETRRKMSEAAIFRLPTSIKTRRKQSEANRGRIVSKETGKKISVANLSRPRKIFCKYGHLRSGENLYTTPSTGGQGCLVCYYLSRERKIPERLQCYLNP